MTQNIIGIWVSIKLKKFISPFTQPNEMPQKLLERTFQELSIGTHHAIGKSSEQYSS